MSNAVYPTLPGLTFPTKRAPVWKTSVKTTPSGRTWRRAFMQYPRYRISLQYNFLRSKAALAEFQTLFGFFNARGGSADSFLLRLPDDQTVTGQAFGVGDGSTTQFQLVRALGGFVEPVHAVDGAATISVDGVPAVNLLTNGSFETDANANGLADGWSTYSLGTVSGQAWSIVTTPVVDGAKAQRAYHASSGGGAMDRTGVENQWSTVAATDIGKTVTWSVSVRGTAGAKATIVLGMFNGPSAMSYPGQISSTLAGTGTVTRMTTSATIPANTTRVKVYVWIDSSAGASELIVDAAQLQFGAVATAFSAMAVPSISDSALVTFTTPPPAGAVLTWSGNYFWRCTFDADELPFERFMHQFWKTGEVRLITEKP